MCLYLLSDSTLTQNIKIGLYCVILR